MVLAVLITLITAPLGSFGISIAGPYLLNKSDPDMDCNNDEECHPDNTHGGVKGTLPRPNSEVMRSAHLIGQNQNDDDEDDESCDDVHGDATDHGGAENLAYENEKHVATAL